MLLRLSNNDDCKLLFDWANDPSVRQNAFNQKPIEWEGHKKWFSKMLDSEGCSIYIAEVENTPVGQIRFQLNEGNWEIDYSISTSERGNGYGKEIVKKGCQLFQNQYPSENIIAKVKPENIPSIKVFEGLLFKKVSSEDFLIFKYIPNA